MDNPSKYEHHHMSNKTVLVVDQQMKVTVSMHPSLRNLIGVVPDLHDFHHHQYKAVRWIVVHEK
jgi:aromatic ring hydroxylase